MILKTQIEGDRYVTYTKQPNGVIQRFESKYTVDVVNRVCELYNEKDEWGYNRYSVYEIRDMMDLSTKGQVVGIIKFGRNCGIEITRINNKKK